MIGGSDWKEILECSPNKTPSTAKDCIWVCIYETGFRGIWKLLHPKEKEYFFLPFVYNNCFYLDYFLLTNTLVQVTEECMIACIDTSDHIPVFKGGFTCYLTQRHHFWFLNFYNITWRPNYILHGWVHEWSPKSLSGYLSSILGFLDSPHLLCHDENFFLI